jgi:membrane carboxypeptidase/penicillin-binding protein PbpC
VGLEDFYQFLEQDLEFKPIQDLHNYQLGIALGALEMSLLDLSHYFTIFPNQGVLKDLKIDNNQTAASKEIAEEKYIQLINKILNDRKTGIEQFGLKSELNLFQGNYALKTGTSRDYKDSWVIGYTPDFLVGVWVGNADASPTQEVSGQIGAGAIWSETMNLLLNSKYNKKTPFAFNLLEDFNNEGNIEYGLPGDDYQKVRNALKETDISLILNPHNGDDFILEGNTQIIFEAKEKVKWYVNSEFMGEEDRIVFKPQGTGVYEITAQSPEGQKEVIYISLAEPI